MSSPPDERRGQARPRGIFAPRQRGDAAATRNGDRPAPTTAVGDVPPAHFQGAAPTATADGVPPLGVFPPPGDAVPQLDATGPINTIPDNPAPAPAPAPAPGSRAARHRAGAPAAGTSRKTVPASRRFRLAALAIAAVGVLAIGLATGFGAEPSAEPTAQAFLYDWGQGYYSAAGSLTTADPATVAASLSSVLDQLDTSQFFLSMRSVVQHGARAEATFNATVDLADSERVWNYQGRFALHMVNGGWKVDWAPSVINPGLGPGERLAVVNQFPDRAPVLDAKGSPLQQSAPAYVVGVWPQQLKQPSVTAGDFAKVAEVQAGQVAGQIMAAPPQQFLRLATLDAGTYERLQASLREVPGLVVRKASERLYQTVATGLVGSVGSEIDPVLRADGAIYAPGTTVGLSGLEQAYQRQLLGSPTTEVVAVNSGGKQTAVLSRWAGTTGTPLRTTINPAVQNAALSALNASSSSGELVAVSSSTGQVLAVAQHHGPVPLPAAGPLDAKLIPGTAFTVVSAAAVLNLGVKLSAPVPCANSFNVGGQTFTSDDTGQVQAFSADFAEDCGTAFAGLSERFSSALFLHAVKEFGIGSAWNVPVPAFSGSVPPTSNDAALAAETIGRGNVRMSLLSMAMVAGAVDSGSWHVPQVVQPAPSAVARPGTPLPSGTVTALRSLMRGTVNSGAAKAARASGGQVYGQVGLVLTGSTWTSWFVGYQGDVAIAAVEYGKTAQLSAAALAGAFFSAASR